MRISTLFAVLAGAIISSQSSVFALVDGDTLNDGPPAWVPPETDSQSWIDDCQKRIDKAWGKNKKGNQISENARCVFFLKPNGRLQDYFVYSVAAPKTGDDVALKVVRKAAPFKNPPAYLLNERRVLVSFSRTDGQPKSKLSWDNFDYTFVKPEDRLRDFLVKKSKKKPKNESTVQK